jgi:hypothetical protein
MRNCSKATRKTRGVTLRTRTVRKLFNYPIAAAATPTLGQDSWAAQNELSNAPRYPNDPRTPAHAEMSMQFLRIFMHVLAYFSMLVVLPAIIAQRFLSIKS